MPCRKGPVVLSSIAIAVLTMLFAMPLRAQEAAPKCLTDELMARYLLEQGIAADQPSPLTDTPAQRGGGQPVVPVVVHVVWNTAAENIPDATVHAMITQLDEDFNLMNTNAGSVRSVFAPSVADVGIRFCLAQVDPEGNATTGITRTQTTATWFNPNTQPHTMKSPPLGTNAWDPDHYLNIWVCDIVGTSGNIVSGYSYLPVGSMPGSWQDGLVVDYQYGTAPAARTPTHESGHYFGLRHTFDGNSCSSGGDGFSDTPTTDQPTWNCSNTNLQRCGVLTQYENYMDYSGCTAMFTLQQAAYMNNVLNTTRNSLFQATGCGSFMGLAPAVAERSVRVYPNPAMDQMFIDLDGAGPYNVEVFDALGRSVRTDRVHGSPAQLRIDGLLPGRYTVRVDKDGERMIAALAVAGQ